MHQDHQKITLIAQKIFRQNKKYQYCVYNNSLNPFIRIKNILARIITGNAVPSFRKGRADFIEKYKLDEKNKNIIEFGEIPRSGDVLRGLK